VLVCYSLFLFYQNYERIFLTDLLDALVGLASRQKEAGGPDRAECDLSQQPQKIMRKVHSSEVMEVHHASHSCQSAIFRHLYVGVII